MTMAQSSAVRDWARKNCSAWLTSCTLDPDLQHLPLEQLGQQGVGGDAQHGDPPCPGQQPGGSLQRGGVQLLQGVQGALHHDVPHLVGNHGRAVALLKGNIGADVGKMIGVVPAFLGVLLDQLVPARVAHPLGDPHQGGAGSVGGVGHLLHGVAAQVGLVGQQKRADRAPGVFAVHVHFFQLLCDQHRRAPCTAFL